MRSRSLLIRTCSGKAQQQLRSIIRPLPLSGLQAFASDLLHLSQDPMTLGEWISDITSIGAHNKTRTAIISRQARSGLFEGLLVCGWYLLFDVAQPPEKIEHRPQASHQPELAVSPRQTLQGLSAAEDSTDRLSANPSPAKEDHENNAASFCRQGAGLLGVQESLRAPTPLAEG